MEKKNFYAIYSVGTKDFGLDELKNGKKGIYIYENSEEEFQDIKKGDIICFLRTGSSEVYLFEFEEKKEENENMYIILSKKHKKFNNISIGDFKNLYFLKFDTLKSWVRSPLATKRNILKFENGKDILNDFVDIKKLEEVFENINENTRSYYIGNYNKLEDEKNIYLKYESGKFGKEYSIFDEKSGVKNELTDKEIKQALNEIENKNSLKALNNLNELYQCIIKSYSGYYDLTRSIELSGEIQESILESERKIKEIDEKIQKTSDENQKKELSFLKVKEEIVLNEAKNVDEEIKKQELREKIISNNNDEISLEMKKRIFILINKILLIELIIVFIIFVCVGFGIIKFSGNELNIFIGATLTQIMLAFHTIVKSLFNTK